MAGPSKAVSISSFLGIVTVIGIGWGASEYVQSRMDEVRLELAQIDQKAKSYSEAAYQQAKRAHAADYWRAEVSRQQRYLEHLRRSQAPEHEIRQAEQDLEYFKGEMWAAQKAVTE